jgi:phosphatidylinositol alpha 1,6-mannosyltransferase
MPEAGLRVAYFPDSFHEVNGVAHTSRQYEAYARRSGLPFLCIRAGKQTRKHTTDGNVEILELARGPLSFSLEKDLRFDIGFLRHLSAIVRALKSFQPTVIHITGPSEIGLIGAILAHRMGMPLAASWHTNVHEYAGRRLHWLQRMLPPRWRPMLSRRVEHAALFLTARLYRTAQLLFAPNRQLCTLLQRTTRRPCQLMQRGVDSELFSPRWRDRNPADSAFVLGYVGRLSIEKNVALLARIGRELPVRGITHFRFMIVGHGSEEATLKRDLPHAEFLGVLRGEDLSRAYASMDLLVFPSHTDTFGNVVLEALASGVPALVTPDGGPCTIVRDGETGLIRNDADFAGAIAALMADPRRHASMRENARKHALGASWDAIFEGLRRDYRMLLEAESVTIPSTRSPSPLRRSRQTAR